MKLAKDEFYMATLCLIGMGIIYALYEIAYIVATKPVVNIGLDRVPGDDARVINGDAVEPKPRRRNKGAAASADNESAENATS